MHHVVIYGHMGGPGLVPLPLGEAWGSTPAELNRQTAEVLLKLAVSLEDTAARMEAATARRVWLNDEIRPASSPEPVFDGIAARLREEGLGDDAGTAG